MLIGQTAYAQEYVSEKEVSNVQITENSDIPVCTSIDESAAKLRAAMKERQEIITIRYDSSNVDIDNICNEIFDAAMVHTGVPTEGDYLWFQHGGSSASITCLDNYVEITYNVSYYTTAEQEAELNQAVSELMEALALDGKSDAQKIKTIYDYICTNIEYDYTHCSDLDYKLQFTAYGALINKTAVCQGYSNLFYRLALEAGIDSRVVVGTGISGNIPEDHSWNIVKVGDLYYYLDSTWDAGVTDYQYFLKGSNTFENHENDEIMGTLEYNISEVDYDCSDLVEEIYSEGNYQYKLNGSEVIITKYIGSEEDVLIPAELGGKTVAIIASDAFIDNTTIHSLSFSEGLRTIQGRAINNCENLQEIYLPASVNLLNEGNDQGIGGDFWLFNCYNIENVTVNPDNPYVVSIEDVIYNKEITELLYYPTGKKQEVFEIPEGIQKINDDSCRDNNYIKEIILPDSVTYIGYWAFINDKKLEKVNISESCETIGQFAFSGTAIKSIYIPASVKDIYPAAFMDNQLETITVDPENEYCCSVDGVLFCRNALVCYPAMRPDDVYEVPDGISVIEYAAFYRAKYIKQVIFSDTVERIGKQIFYENDHLGSVVIPDSVTEIGSLGVQKGQPLVIFGKPGSYAEQYASEQDFLFKDMNGLDDIASGTLGENIHWTVDREGTMTITGNGIMDDITDSQPWSAVQKVVERVVIEEGITQIGYGNFTYFPNLDTVSFPDSLQRIESWAFPECYYLTTVDIPENVVYIGEYAFRNSGLTKIKLPDGIQYIGQNAFEGVSHDFVIYGKKGSVAEQYANENGFIFCDDSESESKNPFEDVKENDYYYDSVLWAYKNGITSGTDETHFQPNKTCTRAQTVTFLWRAMGEPEPDNTSNPFTDINSSKYYYKAVLWAYQNGIVNGMTKTTFCPNNTVTRGQTVTFLWRAEGQPDATISNPFTDVKSDNYYYKAVLWAYENGITSGVTKTSFEPTEACTRAQVVTFLYRDMN